MILIQMDRNSGNNKKRKPRECGVLSLTEAEIMIHWLKIDSMLITKCILCPPLETDGVRISIMSRHTHNDGITPDTRITEKSFLIHLKLLAPSPKLIGDYYKTNLPWEEFEKRYLDEIRTYPKNIFLKSLAKIALETDVTILCIEDTSEYCHRRLLAEECKRIVPELKITHG
jgi:uncharacterized protein YeaO (DUF488 family)